MPQLRDREELRQRVEEEHGQSNRPRVHMAMPQEVSREGTPCGLEKDLGCPVAQARLGNQGQLGDEGS